MSPSILSPVHTIVRTVLDEESHRTVIATTHVSQYTALTYSFLRMRDVIHKEKRELAFGLAIGAEEWGITDYSIELSFQFG